MFGGMAPNDNDDNDVSISMVYVHGMINSDMYVSFPTV